MLFLLVACAAAQLGGEETDGFTGDSLPDGVPDTGGAASAEGMSSPSTRGADETTRGGLEAFGMVGGVAVTDHGVEADDCASMDFGGATSAVDPDARRLEVTYGLPAAGESAQSCVVSWTYLGLDAGIWTLDVDGRIATFEVF